jgi:hypothetical protein
MLEREVFLMIEIGMEEERFWPFLVLSFGGRRLIGYRVGIVRLAEMFVVDVYSSRIDRFYDPSKLALMVGVVELMFLADGPQRSMRSAMLLVLDFVS